MSTLAIDYQSGLSNAVANVLAFVPKLVIFLIILLVGYLIAKAIAKAVDAILERVGFDNAVERGGVKKALSASKYDASDILSKLVYYAIMLFVLSTAFGVFGPNPISNYLGAVISYLPLIFVAILIVVVASAIAAAVKALIENSLGGLSYGKLVANIASTLILAFGVIAALNQLHVATNVVNGVLYATLAAIVGVVVVAVGGGGIKPMQSRWESTLSAYDSEKTNVASQVRSAPSVADQARQAKDAAQSSSSTGTESGGSYRTTDRF